MCIKIAGYPIEIIEVNDNRIEKVRVQPQPKRKRKLLPKG
jgi:CBS domain containing-hemolysin-like protein